MALPNLRKPKPIKPSKEQMQAVLLETNGSLKATAKKLETTWVTVNKWVKDYKINPDDYKQIPRKFSPKTKVLAAHDSVFDRPLVHVIIPTGEIKTNRIGDYWRSGCANTQSK